MSAAFTDGIVCILDDKNIPVGTGVVVSSFTGDVVVTCAHVFGEQRPEQATVTFHATNERREARVIDQWWRSPDGDDIAVLQVVGSLPHGVRPLPLGTATGTSSHTIHTFGYPEAGEVEGVLGYGTVLGLGARTKAGLPLLQIRSSEITAGFSAAPVWDEQRQRVIGIVVIVARPVASSKKRLSRRQSYEIPGIVTATHFMKQGMPSSVM